MNPIQRQKSSRRCTLTMSVGVHLGCPWAALSWFQNKTCRHRAGQDDCAVGSSWDVGRTMSSAHQVADSRLWLPDGLIAGPIDAEQTSSHSDHDHLVALEGHSSPCSQINPPRNVLPLNHQGQDPNTPSTLLDIARADNHRGAQQKVLESSAARCRIVYLRLRPK